MHNQKPPQIQISPDDIETKVFKKTDIAGMNKFIDGKILKQQIETQKAITITVMKKPKEDNLKILNPISGL